MKRTIVFGDYTATLNAGEHRAALTVNVSTLPVELADHISEIVDVYVREVMKDDDGSFIVAMTHDLQAADLLQEIADAISEVYDTDTTITNERASDAV